MIRPVQKDLYAVIGNPVAHSLSPVMMNAVFQALKIPAVYLALQVDDLAKDLTVLSKLGIRGLSVTIPHKESAYRLAESVDEPAQAMGAVNTLRPRGTRWEGLNTDWIGAIAALSQTMGQFETHSPGETPPFVRENAQSETSATTHHSSLVTHPYFEGKRALVIGAGGVARAVVYGLKHGLAAVTISNRGIERGEALARAFDCRFVPLSELSELKEEAVFDIIVQCTSVGLLDQEDATSFPGSLFHPGTVVMDTVYRPSLTPFLRKAEAAGCVAVSGVEMLLHQGVAQLQWWFGELIQPEVVLPVMREALRGILADE